MNCAAEVGAFVTTKIRASERPRGPVTCRRQARVLLGDEWYCPHHAAQLYAEHRAILVRIEQIPERNVE